MDYIVIRSSSKSETAFLLKLFKKMQKKALAFSSRKIEEYAWMNAMEKGEKSGKGSMKKVRSELMTISHQASL